MRLLHFIFCLLFAPLAGAATVTDHWWNPTQPGYGLVVEHAGEAGYALLYDYGADGSPRWYLVPELDRYGSTASGLPAFRGDVYRVQGTPYGAPFDPTRRGQTRVGTINLEPQEMNRMLVETTIDGVTRSQWTQRLAWAAPEYGYRYLAGFAMRRVTDGEPAPQTVNYFAPLDVERSGNLLVIRQHGAERTCVYTGNYAQEGRLGKAIGTYRCDEDDVGTFTASELEVTGNGISGKIERVGAYYREYGRFGGAIQYSNVTGPVD
jgi:hypothetical protein